MNSADKHTCQIESAKQFESRIWLEATTPQCAVADAHVFVANEQTSNRVQLVSQQEMTILWRRWENRAFSGVSMLAKNIDEAVQKDQLCPQIAWGPREHWPGLVSYRCRGHQSYALPVWKCHSLFLWKQVQEGVCCLIKPGLKCALETSLQTWSAATLRAFFTLISVGIL